MARDVAWSSAARDDYLEIIRYVAERNPDAALRLAKNIDRVAANHADLATGRPGRVTGTFEKMVPASSYIVAYEILRSQSAMSRSSSCM